MSEKFELKLIHTHTYTYIYKRCYINNNKNAKNIIFSTTYGSMYMFYYKKHGSSLEIRQLISHFTYHSSQHHFREILCWDTVPEDEIRHWLSWWWRHAGVLMIFRQHEARAQGTAQMDWLRAAYTAYFCESLWPKFAGWETKKKGSLLCWKIFAAKV